MILLDSSGTNGTSVPLCVLEILKCGGFALHLIPMGVLLIGIPLAILSWLLGGVNCRRLAQRIFQQSPVFVIFTIFLGGGSLLLIQLTYSKIFYSTTIIFAAYWLGTIPLLLITYGATFLCAGSASKEKIGLTAFYAGATTLCILAIGLIFSSILTVFERPYLLENTIRSTKLIILGKTFVLGGAGAVDGLGAYWKDVTIYIRLVCLFGLACHSLAFWIVFDTFKLYSGPRVLFGGEQMRIMDTASEESQENESSTQRHKRQMRLPLQENPEKYSEFVVSAACFLIVLGGVITLPALLIYDKHLSAVAASVTNSSVWSVTTGGIYVGLGLPLIFLILGKLKKLSGNVLAYCMGGSEFTLVGTYAIWRQMIQKTSLSPYSTLESQASILSFADYSVENLIQWTPFFLFIVSVVVVGIWFFILRLLTVPKNCRQKSKKNKKEKAVKKSKSKKSKRESTNMEEDNMNNNSALSD